MLYSSFSGLYVYQGTDTVTYPLLFWMNTLLEFINTVTVVTLLTFLLWLC